MTLLNTLMGLDFMVTEAIYFIKTPLFIASCSSELQTKTICSDIFKLRGKIKLTQKPQFK
jgi:hypothetical protein